MKTHTSEHEPHRFPLKYFLTALAVFCLGHWLGTLALQRVYHAIPECKHSPLLLAVASCVLSWVFSSLMHQAHHQCPRPKAWRERAWQFILAIGGLVSAFFVAAGLEHWLQHGPLHLAEHAWWFTLFCWLALVGAERVFHSYQIQLERPRDIRPHLHLRQQVAEPVQALILFVSTPTPGVKLEVSDSGKAEDKHAVVTFKDGKPDATTVVLKGAGNVEADIHAISAGGFWNWQQILRSLKNHTSLKQVVLLGSESDKGSYAQLDLCRRFLSPYLPGDCKIRLYEKELNFTDFNKLVDALRDIILKDLRALPKGCIAIDVTGGQTTASIAGAATTMNLECVFQYVNTNPPFNVLTYDLLHEGGPHVH